MRTMILALVVFLAACSAPAATDAQTLSEARAGHQTVIAARADTDDPVETPPASLFSVVSYPAASGAMAAYVTPRPADGQRHPAIIWMTGGDSSTIGDVWSPAPAANDQSARAFREAGIVMMYPSLRGGNRNPGEHEGAYGEVQDVLAAADWLAKQDYVDPQRIYLGGHSTGGTLVLLTAEMSDRFRAIFAFGPVSQIDKDYAQYLGVRLDDQKELDLRSPGLWLGSITRPTFVFEGDGAGNRADLRDLERRSANPLAQFFVVRGADHFSILSPTTALIARKILADTGEEPNLDFTQAELDGPFAR